MMEKVREGEMKEVHVERSRRDDRGGRSALREERRTYVFVIYPLSWNQRVYVCELEEQ